MPVSSTNHIFAHVRYAENKALEAQVQSIHAFEDNSDKIKEVVMYL